MTLRDAIVADRAIKAWRQAVSGELLGLGRMRGRPATLFRLIRKFDTPAALDADPNP